MERALCVRAVVESLQGLQQVGLCRRSISVAPQAVILGLFPWSPERSVSRSQISQQRRPLCLVQNQHVPVLQSGKIAVNRPPHCSHHLLSAPIFSRVLVRKSPRSKSVGIGFGPASGVSAGAPRPPRKDHLISTDSIVATHSSSFLLSIRTASSSGAPTPSGRRPPLKMPPYK
jgi:hypothetical protein